MYILKDGAKEEIKKQLGLTNRDIAYTLGITEGYVSKIMNKRKTNISKMMAYAFCKAVSTEAEIEDLFDII